MARGHSVGTKPSEADLKGKNSIKSGVELRESEGVEREESENSDDTDDDNNDGNSDNDNEEIDGDEEEEEEEEEECLGPKVLPNRETRGRRIQALIGEAVEQDQEFWGHQTWEEEQEDEEWSTEDEEHYKDIVDSDFDATESEDEGEFVISEEQKALDLEEQKAKFKQRGRQYQDPRKLKGHVASKKRIPIPKKRVQKAPSSGVSEARPLPPSAAKPRAELGQSGLSMVPLTVGNIVKRGSTKRKLLSQEDHLAIAVKTEQENTKRLNAMVDHENWKKAMREQKRSGTTWFGAMELLISWSSERLIEYEEQQKLRLKTERSSVEIQEDPYCREMLFFVDFENPINSSIPEMYQQKNSYMKLPQEKFCSVFPNQKARYRDPITGEFYCNLKAFRELRRRCQKDWSLRLESRLKSFDVALKNVLHYVSKNNLMPFSKIERKVLDQLPDRVMGEEKSASSCDDLDLKASSQMVLGVAEDEARHPVDDDLNVPNTGRKDRRIKRQKRASETSLSSPKRLKRERSVVSQSIRSSPAIGPSVEMSTKTEVPDMTINLSPKAKIEQPDVAEKPVAMESPPTHPCSLSQQFQVPYNHVELPALGAQQAFALRRQPLRIRSTANAFYQQSGLQTAPYGTTPQAFFPTDLRVAPPLSFFSPPPPSIDPLTLYSLSGGPNYSPFVEPNFPPLYLPSVQHSTIHPSIGRNNTFRPINLSLSAPTGRPLSSSPDLVEGQVQDTMSSVYCYPHTATESIFLPPQQPVASPSLAQSSERPPMSSSTTSGVPLLPHLGIFPGLLPYTPQAFSSGPSPSPQPGNSQPIMRPKHHPNT